MASMMRPTGMKGFVAVAVSVLTGSVLILTGCASSGGAAPGGPATGSLSASPLPTPTETPTPLPESTDPTIIGPGTVTLTGTVRQGAEPSCLIVQTSAGQIELLNAHPVPKDGDRVRVTGHVVQAMSHCMQGRPFLVEKLTIG